MTTAPEIVDTDALEIDEEELRSAGKERGKILDLSGELRLLARQNRLSLFKNRAARRRQSNGNWLAEAELQFQSLPHPDCHFMQAMLTVNLELTPGARVMKLHPEQGKAHPVKVSETQKPGFEMEIPGIGIKTSLGGERTTEQTVDLLVLVGYNGEDRAIWSFKAPTSGYELQLNVPLQLAVEYPASADVLRATVEVSARVGVRGWADFIPLFRRSQGTGQTPVYLDR